VPALVGRHPDFKALGSNESPTTEAERGKRLYIRDFAINKVVNVGL
jgi:hypothetical protein